MQQLENPWAAFIEWQVFVLRQGNALRQHEKKSNMLPSPLTVPATSKPFHGAWEHVSPVVSYL